MPSDPYAHIGPGVDIAGAAFIHPTAAIYGDVAFAEGSSAWLHVAIRAEMFEVRIGPYANVQDRVVIHVGSRTGTHVGAWCSLAHGVTLHGCALGDNVLVGIGATIMDGCVIGDNSIVAGHAFVREGTVVPPNSIVMGAPATVRSTRDNRIANRMNAWIYWRNAQAYAVGDHRLWSRPEFHAERAAELARLIAGGA